MNQNLLKNISFLLVATSGLFGCSEEFSYQDSVNAERSTAATTYNCATKKENVEMDYDTLSFPRKGQFWVESHLATTEDIFEDNRKFPMDKTELVKTHMKRSCSLLRKNFFPNLSETCSEVYDATWERTWTPAENGKAGQGSVSVLKPTPTQEMWSANMKWSDSSKPKPGEKWLLKYDGKTIVVAMGFETGPGNKKILGGLQPEGQYALGTTNASQIEVGRLADQTLPYGPVTCK